MGFPGKIKFPICPIILPSMATRVSFDQLSVLSTKITKGPSHDPVFNCNQPLGYFLAGTYIIKTSTYMQARRDDVKHMKHRHLGY